MDELRVVKPTGYTIIEHRGDGENVVGRVEYGGSQGGGEFVVGWHQHDCGNRTTIFHPRSWRCEIIANVIFLHRTGEDVGSCDLPWREADLYTLVQTSRR